MAEPLVPSSLMAVMFTDIVKSTEMKSEVGLDEYHRLFRRYEQFVGQAMSIAPTGRILEPPTDGHFIGFTATSDAINAALILQWLMCHEPWPYPFAIRIGLHLGQVSVIKSELDGQPRYSTLSAAPANRVMSLALGKQILVTRAVYDEGRDLVRVHPQAQGHPTPALRWEPHGSYIFKGSRDPVEVYEVGAEGVAPFTPPPDAEKAKRVSAPPTPSPRPDNIPGLPAGIIDRLRAYADKLRQSLQTVGFLSAPKAEFLNAGDASDTLILRQLREVEKPRVSEEAAQDGRARRGETPPPMPQQAVFDDIVRNRKSYLLRASVGSGKSVMLESFARQMIQDAEAPLAAGSLQPGLRIPLLVRLRDFNDVDEPVSVVQLLRQAESQLFRSADDGPPALQPADIAFLAEKGHLVPLFDGFDEFARHEELATSLGDAKQKPALLKNCGWAITSRPEASAVSRIPIETRTVEPLTDSEILAYVTVKRRLDIKQMNSAAPGIRRLLSQPLYLCTWCNCIVNDRAPQTLGDLMDELFVEHLERRRAVMTRRECRDGKAQLARKQQIIALRSLLGRVCVDLAVVGFGKKAPISKLSALSDADHALLLDIAPAAGIVQRIPAGADDAFYINQVPVVEYLVGRQLGEAFSSDAAPEARKDALGLFRQWVWRPAMHDVLDHFFDCLWHAGDAGQTQAAAEFLRWLVDVSDRDPTSQQLTANAVKGPYAQDDLLHPFCVSALRWLQLNSSPAGGDHEMLLTKISHQIARLEYRWTVPEKSRSGHILDVVQALERPALSQLIDAYLVAAAMERNQHFQSNLKTAIFHAAEWVAESEAFFCFQRLLDASTEDKNAGIRSELFRAIKLLARRIAERDVMACVERLIAAVMDERLGTERRSLVVVIWIAAERVAEGQIRYCIQRFFDAAAGAKGNPFRDSFGTTLRELMASGIWTVARRVPKEQAASCVQLLLEAARHGENADIRDTLGLAIQRAAARVADDQALSCVQEWLEAAKDENDARVRDELSVAIRAAAGQLSEVQALSCVQRWLDAAQQYENAGIRKQLGWAIGAAAGCVREDEALPCAQRLLDAAVDAANADIRGQLGWAIAEVVKRGPINEAEVMSCIRRLLDEGDENNAIILGHLHEAIIRLSLLKIARLMNEAKVSFLIELLLVIAGETNDRALQMECGQAIWNAAHRVDASDAFPSLKRLIAAAMNEKNKAFKFQLQQSIDHVAGRVAEDDAPSCIETMCDPGTGHIMSFGAIRAAAHRVRQGEVFSCIKKWFHAAIDERRGDVKYRLECARRDIAGRIPRQQQFEATQWAIAQEDRELAFSVAEPASEVAIVSTWGNQPIGSRRGVSFQAKLRADMELELTADAVAAPEAVKAWGGVAAKAGAPQPGNDLDAALRHCVLPLHELKGIDRGGLIALALLYSKLTDAEGDVLRLHLFVGGIAARPGDSLTDKEILERLATADDGARAAWKLDRVEFKRTAFPRVRQRLCRDIRDAATFNERFAGVDFDALIAALRAIRFLRD